MRVEMVQHPVGQGGLFSGNVTSGAELFRWVYDCGSNQHDPLSREISAVAAGGKIDLLFLSHLDSDHVSGVDRLLTQVAVREVVLPYLDETALILIVAREADRGTLSGLFVDAVNDLASWFGSRGVKTITFVNGPNDGGEGPTPPETPIERGGEGPISAKWTRPPEVIGEPFAGASARQRDADRIAEARIAPAGAALTLVTSHSQLNWILIPYVHVPPARLMRAFESALEAVFGKSLDKKEIIRSARDPAGRAKLRTCYDALWCNHNLVSMTLYSGPTRWQPNDTRIRAGSSHHYFSPRHCAGGWILTGDAQLNSPRRRQAFLHYYRNFTPLTNVFMLPHHGSIHNHSAMVLSAMPNLAIGYAASGPNSYGHPHRDVCDEVDAHGSAQFHRVGQRPSTRLKIKVELT